MLSLGLKPKLIIHLDKSKITVLEVNKDYIWEWQSEYHMSS